MSVDHSKCKKPRWNSWSVLCYHKLKNWKIIRFPKSKIWCKQKSDIGWDYSLKCIFFSNRMIVNFPLRIFLWWNHISISMMTRKLWLPELMQYSSGLIPIPFTEYRFVTLWKFKRFLSKKIDNIWYRAYDLTYSAHKLSYCGIESTYFMFSIFSSSRLFHRQINHH